VRKILLYHGQIEGNSHKVIGEEGTLYEHGEISPRIFDTHPSEEELEALAQETQRDELSPHRSVQ